MRHIFSNKKGFTLIELLVVIAIIGVLSTMAIIALGNARAKARDSKRVADIKQIATALELYYADNNSYPTIITPGNSITSPDGTKTYMTAVPNNPTPRNDNGCGDNNYTYASTPDNTNYSLNFCLGNNVSSTPAGINSSSSTGVGTAPGLVGWWKFDEGTGTAARDSSGNNNNVIIAGAAPTWISGAPCRTSKCLRVSKGFSGTASIYALSSPSLNITNAMTITGWIYSYAPDENGNQTMALALKNGAYYFAGSDWGSKCVFGWGNYQHAPGLSSLTWYYLTATATESGTASYYINGVLITPTISIAMPLATSANALYFGARDAYILNGMLSDVRIYNRALSAAEVLALYNASKP